MLVLSIGIAGAGSLLEVSSSDHAPILKFVPATDVFLL